MPQPPQDQQAISPLASDVSRRDFMVRGSMGLSAAALASHHAYAVDTAPKKVRIGVVGGGFGCSFLWHEHPDCEVVAVSDLREERRKRLMDTYKCGKAYNSLEELVKAPDIDAVAVFTDGNLHVQHVLESMSNGKHCISAVLNGLRHDGTSAHAGRYGKEIWPDLYDGGNGLLPADYHQRAEVL